MTMLRGRPWISKMCFCKMSKVSDAVMVVVTGTRWVKEENRFMITKMLSNPSDLGKGPAKLTASDW